MRELQPQAPRNGFSGGIDVHQGHTCRGDPSTQHGDEQPYDPAPDHDDAIASRRSRVPHGVEGGLHVRSKHGTLGRQAGR